MSIRKSLTTHAAELIVASLSAMGMLFIALTLLAVPTVFDSASVAEAKHGGNAMHCIRGGRDDYGDVTLENKCNHPVKVYFCLKSNRGNLTRIHTCSDYRFTNYTYLLPGEKDYIPYSSEQGAEYAVCFTGGEDRVSRGPDGHSCW